jgi:hypothetical protein
MDPNTVHATLVALADTVTALEKLDLGERGGIPPTDLELQFRDQFTALDEWLRSGGFRPSAWQHDLTLTR